MDFYVRELSSEDWAAAQADTQFMGANMSHELGALLITETISHSLTENKPVFCLFVDARSAFDLTIREITVRKLFLIGTTGQKLTYIDNRLKCRKTIMEWDRKVLGPIADELGYEQGGISSSDLYVIYNNEQLDNAQASGLGIDVGDVHVAAAGQADDVLLISHDLNYLNHLLQLTLDYCDKHHVTLAPEKTKLMAFYKNKDKLFVQHQILMSPISINNTHIDFVPTTEHVGIIRSNSGNLPHLQHRISSHSKALYSVLPAGLARNQSANPAASLRVESLYALPVLLSGVAPLLLNSQELKVIHSHHRICLQNIQKLRKNTPQPFIFFMAGSPGLTAHIHMRQLGLFGMICRLPENILHKIAKSKLLSEPDSSPSWFVRIRLICTQYNLPSPVTLLTQQMTKHSYKSLIKSRVLDFWETSYRQEALLKSSLQYFKPQFMSLARPHPLWTTCPSSSFEVNKCYVVANLLSGRYPTDWLARKWSSDNPAGHCTLCPGHDLPGTLEHMLVHCGALASKRILLANYLLEHTKGNPLLSALVNEMFSSTTENLVQFLLDPSVTPAVIAAVQFKSFSLSDVFSLTRTYVYAIHRRRLQLIGKFNVL